MRHFKVPINSNLFNTFEYVVFDLILAILVYVLTSKLVGLYNCYDALQNHQQSHIREDTRAPLFETGIVCTQKKVFYSIVAIRILSWILIFSTNLLIRGRSEKIIEKRTESVTTFGRFSAFDPMPLLRERQFRRKACVGRTENFYYYGEIRNNNCQIDRDLFSGPTVKFGLEFEPTRVSISGCRPKNESIAVFQYFDCNNTATTTTTSTPSNILCTYNTTDGEVGDELCFQNGTAPFTPCVRTVSKYQYHHVPFNCGAGAKAQKVMCNLKAYSERNFSICDNAVVGCRKPLGGYICAGFVNINATTHMCENLQLGDQQNTNATCKMASGAVWNNTDWLSFYGISTVDTISNIVAVTYGSGLERKQVKYYKAKDKRTFTSVNLLWTGALAAKIFMVMALYVTCELLSRRYGVFVVANDEPRILLLLNDTATRIRRGREARFGRDDIKLKVAFQNGVVRLHEGENEIFEE